MRPAGCPAIEVPPTWKVAPLRSVASVAVSNVDKLTADGENPVRLCNYTDVYNNDRIHPGLDLMSATATTDEIARFRLQIGDVVITKDSESWDDIAVPALVAETADDLVCGYHLAILRPQADSLAGAFLFRCLQARPVRVQLELSANGVTRFGLPKASIGSLEIPLPPRSEQDRIADYLDREAARLDALVAAKERLLTLLAEKRRALVTRAVTRGLDPNVPMRDSGVPWLGEVPAHWEVERSRWLFAERDERSSTGTEELLTVSHLTGVTPRSEKDVNMFEAETTEGYKLCFRGDLVINTLWAWMGAMGTARVDGIVSPAYNVYTPCSRLDPAFIDALVRIPTFAQEVTRYSKGVWSSRLRLYPEGFFEAYFPVPPFAEQQAIVTHIVKQMNRIDGLAAATERSFSLLKERRAASISAAVTGRMVVPEGRG